MAPAIDYTALFESRSNMLMACTSMSNAFILHTLINTLLKKEVVQGVIITII